MRVFGAIALFLGLVVADTAGAQEFAVVDVPSVTALAAEQLRPRTIAFTDHRNDEIADPGTGLITRQVIPSLTMWQSEWVFLRAQYQWQKVFTTAPTHQIALQAVWAIGPHKHETY